tara:strand:+ start:2372 stop:2626 length:255 start_codon:yes stop_codon:yes gene_type:complete
MVKIYNENNLKYYANHGKNIEIGSRVTHINDEKFPEIYTVTKIGPGDEKAIQYPGVMFAEIEDSDGVISHGVPLHRIELQKFVN